MIFKKNNLNYFNIKNKFHPEFPKRYPIKNLELISLTTLKQHVTSILKASNIVSFSLSTKN